MSSLKEVPKLYNLHFTANPQRILTLDRIDNVNRTQEGWKTENRALWPWTQQEKCSAGNWGTPGANVNCCLCLKPPACDPGHTGQPFLPADRWTCCTQLILWRALGKSNQTDISSHRPATSTVLNRQFPVVKTPTHARMHPQPSAYWEGYQRGLGAFSHSYIVSAWSGHPLNTWVTASLGWDGCPHVPP